MSTRGTYRFSNPSGHSPPTTIYIHTDNYPDGGAAYLYNALIRPSKGCMATQFIRANKHAEITSDPDDHGDTEYHYEVKGHGPGAHIEVLERKWADDGNDSWRVFFVGSLHEYIASRFSKGMPEWCPDMADEYKPFKEVRLPYGRVEWLNEITAKQYLERDYSCLNNLRAWKGKHDKSHSWNMAVEETVMIVSAFEGLLTDEIAELTGMKQLVAELEAPPPVLVPSDPCDIPW